MTLAAALANWSNVYRAVLCSREVKPYNLEVAVQYGTMEEAATYMVNDDASYMNEKMAKEAA